MVNWLAITTLIATFAWHISAASNYDFTNCTGVNDTVRSQIQNQTVLDTLFYQSIDSSAFVNESYSLKQANCQASNSTGACFQVDYRYNLTSSPLDVVNQVQDGYCVSYTELGVNATNTAQTTTTTTITTTSPTPTFTAMPNFNFTKVLNPGISPVDQIAQQFRYQSVPSIYTPNGALPYAYDGPLNWFVSMARPFRESLMRSYVVQMFDANNFYDIGTILSNSTAAIIVVVITFLLSLLSLLSAPFMIHGFYRQVQKEKMRKKKALQEEKEVQDAEVAAAKGLTARDLEKERERKLREKKKQKALMGDDDDKSEKIRIYSFAQRLNAVFFLLIVLGLQLSCLIITSVASAQADNSFDSFTKTAFKSLGMLKNTTTTLEQSFATMYSNQTMSNYAYSITTLPQAKFTQNMFPLLYPNTSTFLANITGLQQNLRQFMGNVSELSSNVDELKLLVEQLNNYVTSALTDMQSPQIPDCVMKSQFLPTLYSDTVASVDFDGLSSFSAQVAKINDSLPSIDTQSGLYQSYIQSMYDSVNIPMINRLAQNLFNFGVTVQSNSRAGMQFANIALSNATRDAQSALNQGASLMAFRSNGAYVAIMFSFFATLASALLLLFGRFRFVRFMNVCHALILATFWALCGLTLVFAYLNVNMCNAANERFSTWQSGLNVLAPGMDVPKYINQAFLSRQNCLANNSRAYIQMTVNYVEDRLAAQDRDLGASLQSSINITRMAVELSGSAGGAYNFGSFQAAVRDGLIYIVNNLQGVDDKLKEIVGTLVSAPTTQYVNALNQPILRRSDLVDNSRNQLLAYVSNVNETYFTASGVQTPSLCSDQYKTVGVSQVNDVVVIKIQTLLNQIQAAQSKAKNNLNNLLDLYVEIQAKADGISAYRSIFGAVGQRILDTLVQSEPQNIFPSLVYPTLVRIAADIIEPLDRLVDCQPIAQELAQVEGQCQSSLVGFDAAFWGFGALAVLTFLQIRALLICADRLAEDSRWLIMALLLRQTNKQDSATEKLVKKTNKTNATGTSYLVEQDFDVSFNDPTLAHTRV
ncbi:hypothetical protein MIR68_004707 [Amoeboaphelidium protococcarum]|nr:hypothetical protein MIR68_004707 [Amoeboaphelidium protococcarum]KAI3653506.1 hypothetical protein MP228_001453 [Amoeboaphelidium protococcarum]